MKQEKNHKADLSPSSSVLCRKRASNTGQCWNLKIFYIPFLDVKGEGVKTELKGFDGKKKKRKQLTHA